MAVLQCWSPSCGKDVDATAVACPHCGSLLRVRDKYRIVRICGEGGMGVVFEAKDTTLGRQVALKLMHGRIAQNQGKRERFETECRAMAQLDHPGIARIYEADAHQDQLFLAQEFVRGKALKDVMADWANASGSITVSDAVRIGIELLEALDHAHGKGIVHRDVNPNNVIMTERAGAMRPVLIDFGMARTTEQEATKVAWGGTPGFAAPEQILEPTSNDKRSDLYAVAAVLYSIITGGHKPYGEILTVGIGQNPRALLAAYNQIAQGAVPLVPANVHVTDISAALSDVLAKALSVQCDERHQTASELIAALRPFATSSQSATPIASASASPAPVTTAPSTISAIASSTTADANTKSVTASVKSSSKWPIVAILGVIAAAGALGFNFIRKDAAKTSDGAPEPAAKSSSSSAAAAASPPVASSANPIRIGILHSMSGTMAISERPVVDATQMAVDEINAEGGVLGRRIEALVEDGQSDDTVFAAAATKLIDEHKVATVFGTWTSASRKTVRPIFEQRDHLLVYPVQYEGLEESLNIVYLGATPNQQVTPAVRYCLDTLKAKRFFIIGSDYVYPRAVSEVIRDELKAAKAVVVGEHYSLLADTSFDVIARRIAGLKPDVILNTINGDSNTAFFRALRAAGVVPTKTPTISFSVGEDVVDGLSGIDMKGDYLAWTYFEELPSVENKAFVEHFKKRYGDQRVVTDPMAAAYAGVRMWAKAVETVKTDDTRSILNALKGISFNAPEGTVRIDRSNNHAWKYFRLGKLGGPDGLEIVHSADKPMDPLPFPMTRTRSEWEAMLGQFATAWKGGWANPAKPVLRR